MYQWLVIFLVENFIVMWNIEEPIIFSIKEKFVLNCYVIVQVEKIVKVKSSSGDVIYYQLVKCLAHKVKCGM